MRITTTLPFFLVTGFACGSTPLGEGPADPCALDPASRACLDRRIVDAGPTPDAGHVIDAGGCAAPPPQLHVLCAGYGSCQVGCGNGARCVDGAWQCVCECADAGPPPPPPHDAGPRACRWSGDCGDEELEYCEQAIGICDATPNPTGVCKPKPSACSTMYAPVCGCDGRDYGNSCEARSAGVGIAERGKCGQRLCQNDTNCFTGTYCDIRRSNDSSCEDCSNLTRKWQCEQHSANCSWQGGRCTTYIEPPPPFDAGVCERKLLDTCISWSSCVGGGGCTTRDNCGMGFFCESEPHSGMQWCSKTCQADSECGTGNVCQGNLCIRACNPWLLIEQCGPQCGGGMNGFTCTAFSTGAGYCVRNLF